MCAAMSFAIHWAIDGCSAWPASLGPQAQRESTAAIPMVKYVSNAAIAILNYTMHDADGPQVVVCQRILASSWRAWSELRGLSVRIYYIYGVKTPYYI